MSIVGQIQPLLVYEGGEGVHVKKFGAASSWPDENASAQGQAFSKGCVRSGPQISVAKLASRRLAASNVSRL